LLTKAKQEVVEAELESFRQQLREESLIDRLIGSKHRFGGMDHFPIPHSASANFPYDQFDRPENPSFSFARNDGKNSSKHISQRHVGNEAKSQPHQGHSKKSNANRNELYGQENIESQNYRREIRFEEQGTSPGNRAGSFSPSPIHAREDKNNENDMINISPKNIHPETGYYRNSATKQNEGGASTPQNQDYHRYSYSRVNFQESQYVGGGGHRSLPGFPPRAPSPQTVSLP